MGSASVAAKLETELHAYDGRFEVLSDLVQKDLISIRSVQTKIGDMQQELDRKQIGDKGAENRLRELVGNINQLRDFTNHNASPPPVSIQSVMPPSGMTADSREVFGAGFARPPYEVNLTRAVPGISQT